MQDLTSPLRRVAALLHGPGHRRRLLGQPGSTHCEAPMTRLTSTASHDTPGPNASAPPRHPSAHWPVLSPPD